MNHEKFLVLDFGGQYNQLIARRVRECSVYCEIKPYTASLEEIKIQSKRNHFHWRTEQRLRRRFRDIRKTILNWESRFWVSAMVPS